MKSLHAAVKRLALLLHMREVLFQISTNRPAIPTFLFRGSPEMRKLLKLSLYWPGQAFRPPAG
jgi:hypothetical protein